MTTSWLGRHGPRGPIAAGLHLHVAAKAPRGFCSGRKAHGPPRASRSGWSERRLEGSSGVDDRRRARRSEPPLSGSGPAAGGMVAPFRLETRLEYPAPPLPLRSWAAPMPSTPPLARSPACVDAGLVAVVALVVGIVVVLAALAVVAHVRGRRDPGWPSSRPTMPAGRSRVAVARGRFAVVADHGTVGRRRSFAFGIRRHLGARTAGAGGQPDQNDDGLRHSPRPSAAGVIRNGPSPSP